MNEISTGKPAGIAKWRPSPPWQAGELPHIAAGDAVQLVPGFDLWDCWPLQHEDGSTVTTDGAQFWFFLSAPSFDDPGQRHFHAKIRLLKLANGRWTDMGPVLPDEVSPGFCEWAGTSVLHDDGASMTLFFTAAGRRGGGPSFEQRIFGCEASFSGARGPYDWQEAKELFCADGDVFMPADKATGKPGAIKAFRDPAWFRDPASGAAYLLFTGSAGWTKDSHNGLIGYASQTGEGWQIERPLIEAVGVNNEMERPHIVLRDGLYYLFWSTQRHTFSPEVDAGPNGLYGAVADHFEGPWRPLNGTGLVAMNPQDEPTQAYSWWVTGEGEVWSFIDHWGMQGRSFEQHPELLRSNFGGTPAPRFRLRFNGETVSPEV